jgi:transcriptional regulator with XRE-family HTH domain
MSSSVALQVVASPTQGSDSKDELVLIVGKNLRRLRTQRGLSLERLAKISGVSRAMLSHIELAQSVPTIVTLDKISKALDIPFTAFLSRNEKKSASTDGGRS